MVINTDHTPQPEMGGVGENCFLFLGMQGCEDDCGVVSLSILKIYLAMHTVPACASASLGI